MANLHPHVTMAAIVAKPIIANALVVGTAVAPGREVRSPPRNRPSTVYQGWPGSRLPRLAQKTTFCRRLRAHLPVPHTVLKRKPTPTLTRNGKSNSISKAMPTATAVRSGTVTGINNSVKAPLETKPTKPTNSKMPLPAAEAALAAIINRRRNRIPLAAAPVSTSMAADVIPARP